jgi:quercetin 2,3-dioxygenase
MTDLAFPDEVSESSDSAPCPEQPVVERIPWRAAEIAPGVHVHRAIPVRTRRTIGAWCFLDLAGPFEAEGGTPLEVGPHPHIGLQTVTWLFDGAVRHRDSIGSDQEIRPRELNVMTSGRGIAHSERTPEGYVGAAHMAQLWVALPAEERGREPSFAHHADLPVVKHDGLEVEVLVGTFEGETSPAVVHTPLVGLQVDATSGAAGSLPLAPNFEYGVVVIEGSVLLDDEPLAPGELLYLGRGRSSVTVNATEPARLLVVGGEPYPDELHMWWNFVGGSREEITRARTEWEAASARFPDVVGDDGERLAAPPIPWR